MKKNLVLLTSWLNSEPSRAQAIGLGLLVVLAVASIIAPDSAVLAGAQSGGSH